MEKRLIAEGEEELCNNFHNRIDKRKRTTQQCKWDFVLNNYNKKPIPFTVVEDDGKIVGTQAFIPIRMIDKDGIYWTAKSEETLVDPDYRGNQLFEKMYSFLFDYAKEDGKETIHDIQKILRQDNFIIHSKVGNTYGTLKDYEF